MLHGPLLFHVQAALFRLFGDSDLTARLWPALAGVGLVLSPYGFRRELGRGRALLAGWLLLLSPSVAFYSRYLRNDVWCAWMSLLAMRALLDLRQSWKLRSLLLLAFAFWGNFAAKETAFLAGAGLGLACLATAGVEWRPRAGGGPSTVWLAGVLLHWVAPYLAGAVFPLVSRVEPVSGVSVPPTLTLLVGALAWVATLLPLVLLAHRKQVVAPPLGPVVVLGIGIWFLLLSFYTSFGRNPRGVSTGLVGSLGYWLAQHEVARGGQPPGFYALLAAFYEPLVGIGTAVGLLWLLPRRAIDLRRGRARSARSRFLLLIGAFAAWCWLSFSAAGERMPWLLVHLVVPSTFLASGVLPLRLLRRWLGAAPGHLLLTGLLLTGCVLVGARLLLDGVAPGRRWVSLAMLGTLLLAFSRSWRSWSRQVGGTVLRQALPLAAICLLLLQVRSLVWVLGPHQEDARELLFYAHGTEELAAVARELERNRREARDRGAPWTVAHTEAVSWPLAWYLRHDRLLERIPNVTSWDPTDFPDVVLLRLEEEPGIATLDRLSATHARIPFRFVSWPPDRYREWRFRDAGALLRREGGRQLAGYLLFRDLPRKPDTLQPLSLWAVLYLRTTETTAPGNLEP